MTLAIIFFFVTYLAMLTFFLWGWRKAFSGNTEGAQNKEHFISVIIPLRNEALLISSLLDDLSAQHYLRFEVILVDDHSEDDSNLIIRKKIAADNRFALVRNNGYGKKMAVTTGIKTARGEIIVTTDADCRVTAGWLLSINGSFQDGYVRMAFGAVRIQPDRTFFSKLQTIEFASLIGSAAATYGLASPTMCNGANLAFRKKIFQEVGGYDNNLSIPSGDDEFLMRKILTRYPDGLKLLDSPESIVTTFALPSVAGFFQQRIRWAGKWRHNSSLVSRLLAITVLLIQVNIIFSVIFLLRESLFLFIVLWMLKIILEFIFLKRVCFFLNVKWSVWAFLSLQITYPFYVIFIGTLSNFLPYQWKGRVSQPLGLTVRAQ